MTLLSDYGIGEIMTERVLEVNRAFSAHESLEFKPWGVAPG